ncbi:MAG: SCP2 sterol-binding domain-containing protein [Gammaproteobacteria bacterium]|nr:SCP2 sterol-binding domain-containing protein [Gammaproteobacteria bacterium]
MFTERAINRLLARDPLLNERLEPLIGKTLGLRLNEPEVTLRVGFHVGGVHLSREAGDLNDCDAVLEATLAGLASLGLSGGQRSSRDVQLRGDIGTIQEVRQLFSGLNLDPDGTLGAGREGAETLLRNLAELATEERGWLPTAPEAEEFIAGVDALRETADRLEARLRRLEQQRQPEHTP